MTTRKSTRPKSLRPPKVAAAAPPPLPKPGRVRPTRMDVAEAIRIAESCRSTANIAASMKPGLFSPREQACVVLAEEVARLNQVIKYLQKD